jgi:transcriptional regulator NrdR family protein
MMCIECRSKTKVIDSRSPGIGQVNQPMIAASVRGHEVFGWWTDEYTVRRLECRSCGERFWTIEVSIKDLRDALTEVKESDTLGTPWRSGSPNEEIQEALEEHEEVSSDDAAWRTQSNLCG